MSGHDQVIAPALGPGGHPGLLGKLMATIRSEFRAEVLSFEPSDPVFGGPLCTVAGCAQLEIARGLCHPYYQRWRKHGRPNLEQYIATTPRVRRRRQASDEQCVNLDHLGRQLKLEVQYALQCRRDDHAGTTSPAIAQRMVDVVAASGVVSILDLTEPEWVQRLCPSKPVRLLLIYARRRIESLHEGGCRWDSEYSRDRWRLRDLGIDGQQYSVRFDGIPQRWLKQLAKTWIRRQVTTGASSDTAYLHVRAITRFAGCGSPTRLGFPPATASPRMGPARPTYGISTTR